MMLVFLAYGLATTAAAFAGAPAGVSSDLVDFRVVPYARTAAEAHSTWDQRRDAVLWAIALRRAPPLFDREHGGARLPSLALARLEVGHEVEATNLAILDPKVEPYGDVGTDFSGLGPFCRRHGDYDFALRAWMPILYRFWNRPDRLWPATRAKILHRLAPERGNQPETMRHFCGIPISETENHVLMTESSRLLTNQLLQRERREAGLAADPALDNERNGMNRWMREHLAKFLREDFEEFNSKPYQPYAVMPIQNLFEYAEDPALREIARGILDYLTAKYAVSSDRLRRLAPFRRNGKYRGDRDLISRDGDAGRILAMTGMAGILRDWKAPWYWDFDHDFAQYALLGSYRMPPAILELLFAREGNSTYQRIRHFVPEIYARTPDFLISGGGVFGHTYAIPWMHPNDANAMPTVLIPTDGETDGKKLIRIEGHQKDMKRNNLCVAPGFACGLNPVLPETLPPGCIAKREGNWTFVDFSARGCPLGYRLRVALYSQKCDTKRCKSGGGRFGFFEAASDHGSTERFISNVLTANQPARFRSEGTNLYVTSDGRRIEFEPYPESRKTIGLISHDGLPEDREWTRWEFADGDVIRGNGRGWIELRGLTGAPLLINVTDPHHPWRSDHQ